MTQFIEHYLSEIYIDRIDNNKCDTIIFLEGIGANLKGWDLFLEPFKRDFNIVRYDHPCAGKSLLSKDRRLDYHDFITALDFVLNSVHGNLHLVGYSLGAFLIFRYLYERYGEKNNQKIKTITLCGGFSYFTDELCAGFLEARKNLLSVDSRQSHIKSLPYLYDEETLQDSAMYKYFVERCLNDQEYISSENFIQQIDACLNAVDWKTPPDSTRKCSVPALIMLAKDDKIITPSKTRELCHYFLHCKLHEYERGGHCFKDIHRDDFCKQIIGWIKKIVNKTPPFA